MTLKISSVLFFLTLVPLFGCTSFLSDNEAALSSYVFNENIDPVIAENAQNILASKCLNCHFQGSQSGHLDFAELINDGFIKQGPPDQTVLYRCINDTCTTRDGRRTANMAVNGNLTVQEITLMNDFMNALFIYVPR